MISVFKRFDRRLGSLEQLDLDLVIGFRQKGKILKALGAWFEYGLLNIGIGCCGLQSKNCGNQL